MDAALIRRIMLDRTTLPILNPTPANDPNDPLNWSRCWKGVNFGLPCFYVFFTFVILHTLKVAFESDLVMGSHMPNHYADTFRPRFSDEVSDAEDVDAAHTLFVHHPAASGIYEDEWPGLIPSIFDAPDGDGKYDAYHLD
ncbi:hypothetical protein BDV11DRAFT_172115 [Aspergillus similis]